MGKRYFMLCVCILIVGCKPVKELDRQEVEIVHRVKETVRDTTVVVSRDSSWLRAWLACDSTGQVIMKELIDYQSGKHVGLPQVNIDNNMLTAKVVVDSFGIFMNLRDKYESNTMIHFTTREQVKEVYRLRVWQKWLLICGMISLLVFCRKLWKLF